MKDVHCDRFNKSCANACKIGNHRCIHELVCDILWLSQLEINQSMALCVSNVVCATNGFSIDRQLDILFGEHYMAIFAFTTHLPQLMVLWRKTEDNFLKEPYTNGNRRLSVKVRFTALAFFFVSMGEY